MKNYAQLLSKYTGYTVADIETELNYEQLKQELVEILDRMLEIDVSSYENEWYITDQSIESAVENILDNFNIQQKK